MIERLLAWVAIMGSGTVAGVMFAVAVSTAPALSAMSPGEYVHAHKLLGRHWDPLMPAIVLGTTVADVVLAFAASGGRVLYAAGAVLLLGVSAVSHLANVPINKAVRALEPGGDFSGWEDPRPRWRRWHLLRTGLAFAACGAVGAGAL